jgi:HlyD family secretion protein
MDKIIEKKKWTPKKISIIAITSLSIIFVFYQILFGDKSIKLNVDSRKISIDEVERDFFQDYISVTGTVHPSTTVFLDALEGGRVEEIFVEEGNMVKKDQPLLRLSNTNLHLNIMNREADLADQMNNLRSTRLSMQRNMLDLKKQVLDKEYQLTDSKRQFEKKKKLFEKKYISEEEYDEAKDKYFYLESSFELIQETTRQDSTFRILQVAQLEESVNRMEDNLKLVRRRLDNLLVKAPMTGQLANLNVQIGESKMQGESLGRLDILDSYIIKADVDEHYISRTTTNLLGDFDFADESYSIKVKKVYTHVNNGRFTVDMDFTSNVPEKIRIGQTFRIRLELGESKEAVLIPRGSFYQKTGGQWIYVLDPDGATATKRKIRLGNQNPRYYEVLEGLEPGEQVITSNYDIFGDAEKLILKN